MVALLTPLRLGLDTPSIASENSDAFRCVLRFGTGHCTTLFGLSAKCYRSQFCRIGLLGLSFRLKWNCTDLDIDAVEKECGCALFSYVSFLCK
jgi:hypothetical protein